MLDSFLHKIELNSIGYVPKVRAFWYSTLGSNHRHVLHKLLIFLESWKILLHRQLIVVGHCNPFHLVKRKNRFFLSEHHLHEILVDHLFWWHIQLKTFLEILNEVLLRPEFPYEFRRQDSPLLRSLVYLHSVYAVVGILRFHESVLFESINDTFHVLTSRNKI